MMDRWSGKVAVVIGASSGIGRSTAIELARLGLNVVGLARRVERIEAASGEAEGGNGSLKAIKCDVRNTEEIVNAFLWIEENVGPVSVLINCAAIPGLSSIKDASQEEVDSLIEVNLQGTITCTKQALESMSRNNVNDGHIININSLAGYSILPMKNIALYSTTKYGITAFTEALRTELAAERSSIRVTGICPGIVATELSTRFLTEDAIASIPMLSDKDVTDCILFALSAPVHVNISELKVQCVGELIAPLN